MPVALISGASGQDAAYLALSLLKKGYMVVGTSRDVQAQSFENLDALGIRHRLDLRSMMLTDINNILHVLMSVRPHEIYNLAGQSSVALSFEQPVEAVESLALGTLNLLEAVRVLKLDARIYNAGSSESFGDTPAQGATEETAFRPRSPYAVGKASAHWLVASYRQAYGMFACNGILFNHDSPLRPKRFVTRKIVSAACRISQGSTEVLQLGQLSMRRDWGWAPEYVEVMWSMMQLSHPTDLVVATGKVYSLQQFVEHAFDLVGLHWRDHVDYDPTLKRPLEIEFSRGLPDRAKSLLGWSAQFAMPEVVHMMMQAERGHA